MTMISKNDDKQRTDDVIGQSLSKAIKNRAASTPCISLKEMAALVDGSLTDEKRRDVLFRHMACCDRCRGIYTLSQELCNQQVREKNKNWYRAFSAMAVAAVVLLVLVLTVRQGDRNDRQVSTITKQQLPVTIPEVVPSAPHPDQAPKMARQETVPKLFPPGAAQAARLLSQREKPSVLLDKAMALDRTKSYGFAANPSPSKTAFHIGMDGLIFDLALLGNDRNAAETALLRIGQNLKAIEGKTGLVAMVNERKELNSQSSSLGSLKGLTLQLEREMPPKVRIFLRFGTWCEFVHLSVLSGNTQSLDSASVHYFERNLPKSQLQPEAVNSLRKIDSELNKQQIDYDEIIRNLEQVISTFQ